MASTNKTQHYELSQFVPLDKPAWLGDYNSDMQKIDAGIYAAQTKADSLETNVESASAAASAAQQAAQSANEAAQQASDKAQDAETTANGVAATASQALTTAQQAQTAAEQAETTAQQAQNTANTASSGLNNLKETVQTINDNQVKLYHLNTNLSSTWFTTNSALVLDIYKKYVVLRFQCLFKDSVTINANATIATFNLSADNGTVLKNAVALVDQSRFTIPTGNGNLNVIITYSANSFEIKADSSFTTGTSNRGGTTFYLVAG